MLRRRCSSFRRLKDYRRVHTVYHIDKGSDWCLLCENELRAGSFVHFVTLRELFGALGPLHGVVRSPPSVRESAVTIARRAT